MKFDVQKVLAAVLAVLTALLPLISGGDGGGSGCRPQGSKSVG